MWKKILAGVLLAAMAVVTVGCAKENAVSFEQQTLPGGEFDMSVLLTKEDVKTVTGIDVNDPVISSQGVDMNLKAVEGSGFIRVGSRKYGKDSVKQYYDRELKVAQGNNPEELTLDNNQEAFYDRVNGLVFYYGERLISVSALNMKVDQDQLVQLGNCVIKNYTAAGLEN
ncbi:MAG: hypothetical protein ACOYJA_04150 [Christensenellales bacterium]